MIFFSPEYKRIYINLILSFNHFAKNFGYETNADICL